MLAIRTLPSMWPHAVLVSAKVSNIKNPISNARKGWELAGVFCINTDSDVKGGGGGYSKF